MSFFVCLGGRVVGEGNEVFTAAKTSVKMRAGGGLTSFSTACYVPSAFL